MKYGCIIKFTQEVLGHLLCSLCIEDTAEILAKICFKQWQLTEREIAGLHYELWCDQKTDVYCLKIKASHHCNNNLSSVAEGAKYPYASFFLS